MSSDLDEWPFDPDLPERLEDTAEATYPDDPATDTKGIGWGRNEKLDACRELDGAFEHIVWADETNKAEPYWDDSGAVPDYIKEKIAELTPDVVYDGDFETLPEATRERVTGVLQDVFEQPGGWSLESVARRFADEFNTAVGDAMTAARTEVASFLNTAREEGYEDAGVLDPDDPDEDPALFEWIGPQDHRTTEACEWLKERTEGGVTFDRLIELEKEATERFFPRLDFRRHVIHPNERHTFVETFKLDHPSADAVEVDHQFDLAPAIGGTFKAVA